MTNEFPKSEAMIGPGTAQPLGFRHSQVHETSGSHKVRPLPNGSSRRVERHYDSPHPNPLPRGEGRGEGNADVSSANRVGTSPEVRSSPEGPYDFEPFIRFRPPALAVVVDSSFVISRGLDPELAQQKRPAL